VATKYHTLDIFQSFLMILFLHMNNTIHPTLVSLVRPVALVAIILSLLLLFALSSSVAMAQTPPGGLIPCEGAECTACDFVKLGNSLLVWLIGVLMVVFAIIAAYAGFRLVTSAGNVEAKSDAKSKLTNAIIGLIIVLAAWILVDTIMRGLLSGGTGEISGYGPWSKIECGVQYDVFARIFHPTVDGSRGVASVGGVGSLDPAAISALADISAPDGKVQAAAAAVGLDAEQTRNLQALMRVESGGCANKVSPVGALGCMQIMPETAKQYDPSLKNLSDAEVRNKLLNDDDYNIALGAKIYQDLYAAYSGDEVKVFAAYNGGPGANLPSRDCPGLMRWQCEWDNPEHTIPNTGYIETRNYVEKVAAVSEQLP
jgi:uncharacterized membrane protein HdeD (DUF308 family)